MSGSPPGPILCLRDIWQCSEINCIVALGAQELYRHGRVEGSCAASVLRCKGNPHNLMSVKANYCAPDKTHCFDGSQNRYLFKTIAITVRS